VSRAAGDGTSGKTLAGWRELLHTGARITGQRFESRIATATVASLLISTLDIFGLALIFPMTQHFTDGGDPGDTVGVPVIGEVDLTTLLIVMVVFFVGKSVLGALLRWWSTGIVAKAEVAATTDLFGAYLAAPLDFHDERHSADQIRSMYSSVNILFNYGYLGVIILATETTTMAVLGVAMFFSSPPVATAAIVYFGLVSLGYVTLVQPPTRKAAGQLETSKGRAIQMMQEGLGGLREYRVRGGESFVARAFAGQQAVVGRGQRLLVFLNEVPRFYLEATFVAGFVLLAGTTLGTEAASDRLPTLAMLATLGLRALPSISRILASLTNITVGRSALSSLVGDLEGMGIDKLPSSPFIMSPRTVPASAGGPSRLELRDVQFTYPGADGPTLTDIDIDVAAGTSLGILGPSGAGKSTLLDVVSGLRRPTAGRVLFDEKEADSSTTRIGLVPQEVFILDADVRTNVAFGYEVDDALVWDALEAARLGEVVRGLPEGLDTHLGERGSRFSGGQRQRIGIARAMYARPSLLVLDEATSSLDVATEAEVVQAVAGLSGRVTVVVVTHRLTTVSLCDNVMVLERGRMARVGPASTILAELSGRSDGTGSTSRPREDGDR